MNIDFYMEKAPLRHIKLIECCYQRQEWPIHSLLNYLNISQTTLRRDFNELTLFFEQELLYSEMNSQTLTLSFNSDYCLNDLTAKLYQQSDFIQVVYDKLLTYALPQWRETKALFQSQSGTSRLTSRANMFITEAEIKKNELRLRMIIADLFVKLNDQKIKAHPLWQKAKEGLLTLIKKQNIHLEPAFFDMMVMIIFLALHRAKNRSLHFETNSFFFLEENHIFQFFYSLYQKEIKEDGIEAEALLSTMLLLQNMQFDDYITARIFRKNHWNQLIAIHPAVNHLYSQLVAATNQTCPELMQKLCCKVLFNTWVGYPCFTPHYLIDSQQREFQMMSQTFIRWSKTHHFPLVPDDICLKEVYYYYSQQKNKQIYTVYIVAPEDDAALLYHHFLTENLNEHSCYVHPKFFRHLKELPIDHINNGQSLILCDRRLINQHEDNLFPLSPESLVDDFKNLILTMIKNAR